MHVRQMKVLYKLTKPVNLHSKKQNRHKKTKKLLRKKKEMLKDRCKKNRLEVWLEKESTIGNRKLLRKKYNWKDNSNLNERISSNN